MNALALFISKKNLVFIIKFIRLFEGYVEINVLFLASSNPHIPTQPRGREVGRKNLIQLYTYGTRTLSISKDKQCFI